MSQIVLPDRTDRFGSNYIAKLSCYILADKFDAKLYHKSSVKYSETMFVKLLLQNSELNNDIKTVIPIIENKYPDNEDIFNSERTKSGKEQWLHNLRCRMGLVVQELGSDIFTLFNKYYKNEMYQKLKKMAHDKNYKLPWSSFENIICIHLRFDDQVNCKDYDGTNGAKYITNLIETKSIHNFISKNLHRVSKDKQTPISAWKFGQLVKSLKDKYPTKTLYIVSTPNIPLKHKRVIKENNIKCISNSDYELDLWILIHTDILVLSKSTYSMIAALFHQGSNIIYPKWGITASAGLGTKFDKTGWESYI